jgi:hypothetical protein
MAVIPKFRYTFWLLAQQIQTGFTAKINWKRQRRSYLMTWIYPIVVKEEGTGVTSFGMEVKKMVMKCLPYTNQEETFC